MAATVDLLAGTVMDASASLMNDTSKSIYTYVVQVPYLRIAMDELQELFELNNISSSQLVSPVINIPAGTTQIIYNGVGVPKLPDDMIEPMQLWERSAGIDPFVPMTRRDYLPHNLEGVQTSQFIYYVWENQAIKFLPANRSNDIKIDHIKQLFTPIVDSTSAINIINAKTFLEYRTSALLAEFIERNKTHADGLNTYASLAIDRTTGIGVKGKQSIMTRRRPFRASYKKRGWIT